MKLFAATTLLLAATVVWAYDDGMVANALRNCSANQLSLNVCSWHRAEQAEKELANTYAQLRSKVLGTPALLALESAQKSWLAYRQSECNYRVSGLTPTGSMIGQIRDDCRKAVTEGRITELRKHLGCIAQGCPGQ